MKKLPPIETETLWVILSLVCIEIEPGILDTWSPEDRELAEIWALKTHLRASDNPVRVPPRPAILDGYHL